MKRVILILIFICSLLVDYTAVAQLLVDGSLSDNADRLVREHFVGGGVDVRNVYFSGSRISTMPSIGTFDGTNSNIGIDNGLIIATGTIFDAPGPNTRFDKTSATIWPGDVELEGLIWSKTFDASILEFDFIPVSRRIEFKYVFASEEYEEFVCSEFNDAFAFLVSGPGINGKRNIALVPGTSDIVSINTVNNGCINSKLDSVDRCSMLPGPCYARNKYSFIANADGKTIEYDGFTKVFTAILTDLQPGATYHIKIVIADVADNLWDSGVFLKGNSFSGNYTLEYTPACINDFVYFWSDATAEASFYKWDFGDGSTSMQESPSHIYTQAGTYMVTLFIELPDGITRDTLIRYVNVSDAIADFSFSQDIINGALYNFTDGSKVKNGKVIRWEWDFGDSSTSLLQNPYHTYQSDGDYNVRLIITADNGCKDTVFKRIKYSTKYIEANSTCINEPVQFRVITKQNIIKYEWQFGDGEISNDSLPVHLYKSVGQYLSKAILENDNNQMDTIEKLIIISDVNADFDYTIDFSSGGTVVFTNKSSASFDNIILNDWNFGDGTGSDSVSTSHTFTNIDSYNVRLIVVTENGCRDTIIKEVNLKQNNFGIAGNCINEPVYFNVSSKWIDYTAEWDFGDGNSSTDKNPVHYYTTAGKYNIRLILTESGNIVKDTIYNQIEVFGVTAGFDFSTASGNNPMITFNDKSQAFGDNIVTWTWDFGDGNYSNEQNPVYRYRNEGTYTVTLIVTGEHGCADTITSVIDITNIKNRILAVEECAGIPCEFKIAGKWNITSCLWNFGDGNTSTNTNTKHTYSVGGEYNVSAVITNDKAEIDSLNYLIRIDEVDAEFSLHKDKSFSLFTKFTDNSVSRFSNIISWFWDFGDGNISKQQNPEHTYMDNKYKKVILIVTNENGCTDTSYNYLNRIELSQNCTGESCDFLYNTEWTNSECQWYFGDGDSSYLKSPSHTYLKPGDYQVRAIIRNMNTNELDTLDELVNITGANADFNYDSIAGAFKYQFMDKTTVVNGNITTWYWNFGDGTVSSEQNPFHEYAEYGIYKVILIVTTDIGCEDTIFKIINNFGKASSLISIPDTCMNTGDTLRLPLILESYSYLEASKNYQFEAVIRFDKSLLLPLPSIQFPYTFDENDCIITINGNRNDQLQDFEGKEVLAWIDLFVLLGSSEEIEIKIESFKWTDGYEADISTKNSRFCILDLCPAGGTRLYYSKGSVELLAPNPNPADDFINIEFEVVADGAAHLFITDITGNNVSDISNGRILPGRYKIKYNTSMLSTGTYYITLRTLSETITRKFMIEK